MVEIVIYQVSIKPTLSTTYQTTHLQNKVPYLYFLHRIQNYSVPVYLTSVFFAVNHGLCTLLQVMRFDTSREISQQESLNIKLPPGNAENEQGGRSGPIAYPVT